MLFVLGISKISINAILLSVITLFPSGQQTRAFLEAVEQYTQLGLRTLCLAWRELKEDEYQEWSLLLKEASSTLVDREVNVHLNKLSIVCV